VARLSTAAGAPVRYGKSFEATWLSDKGAWPVIGILAGAFRLSPSPACRPRPVQRADLLGLASSGAVAFCGTFIARKTLFHPDIR
jgi:hypothetical protein